MSPESALLLAALILTAAFLYSAVGHAGATGYLAAMALFSLPPGTMRPTALILNIFVASIACWKFIGAGRFSGRLFGWLALTSLPSAYAGGYLEIPGNLYRPLVGAALLLAALRFFHTARRSDYSPHPAPPPFALAGIGAALGLLSGMTGIGGGVFLSPLLIFLRWASVQITSGVAAAFILVNSAAGLAGQLTRTVTLSPWMALWAVAAITGGYAGAALGSRRLQAPAMQRLLGVVLMIAAVKMLWNPR